MSSRPNRKLRVLVLMHENLVPPPSIDGFSDKEIAEWATEYDVVAGLQEAGHEVYVLGVGSDLGAIRAALAEYEPHVTFNLLVHFHGVAVYDQHVVSYMELLKKPYTGCNPRGLMLARDKALSKKLLSFHRIRVPKFQVFPLGKRTKLGRHLGWPLLVKSVNEEASLGISQASVVTSADKLTQRVEFMHETFGVDVIVEEYIEGRELYVGVMGNRRLQTFPVWELPMGQLPEPRIATARVKWDLKYQRRHGIKTRQAEGLEPAMEERIAKMCKRMFRVLKLSGYARMDLRLGDNGEVYVLEANPNPDLKFGEDFAESAAAMGLTYPGMLQRVVTLGMAYPVEWKVR